MLSLDIHVHVRRSNSPHACKCVNYMPLKLSSWHSILINFVILVLSFFSFNLIQLAALPFLPVVMAPSLRICELLTASMARYYGFTTYCFCWLQIPSACLSPFPKRNHTQRSIMERNQNAWMKLQKKYYSEALLTLIAVKKSFLFYFLFFEDPLSEVMMK